MDLAEINGLCRQAGIPPDELFERIIETFYRQHLNPGDTAVDVGAHIGRHLLPLSQAVGPTGLAIGFEPLPALCLALIEKTRVLGNTLVLPYALSSKSGFCDFTEVENAPAYSGLQPREIFNAQVLDRLKLNQLKVLRIEADALLLTFPRIRFIKIDVEGGEFDVLSGARALLERDRPAIVFEHAWHSARTYGYTRDAFFGLFAAAGYRLCDCLGAPFLPSTSDAPWYLFAFPAESDLQARLCDIVAGTVATIGG